MKQPTWFSKLIDWIFSPHYDCLKDKHHWAYKLSESGKVFLNENNVPWPLWHCMDCGDRKFSLIKSFSSTCKYCGIIKCEYIGVWKNDHYEEERLVENHYEECKE